MATQRTKVFAPQGYHFMIKKAGGFYLMTGAYTPHTLANGDKSSEYVLMQYRTEHPTETTSSSSSTSTRTTRSTVRTTSRTSTNTSAASTSTTSSRSSSSGSSSSGGGY